MIRRLPGTTIEIPVQNGDSARKLLDNVFMAGGLVLSQVSGLTGLEPYMVQNWIKRGFLAPPQHKKYSRRQFCRVAIINMLRDVLQIEKITNLLSYINGRLDDESDDIIDDSELYLYCIDALNGMESERVTPETVRARAEESVKDFEEPFPGAKRRLVKVLEVVIYAHFAAAMRTRAEDVINTLD
ncbi:MAG: DUF1836 domain-containing protein [Clostridia bacterium]|nr:DUF1836 domain-containing protein [Clostridia bacterium]